MNRETDLNTPESRWTTVYQELRHPKELRIAVVRFPNEELRYGRRWMRRLLGMILHQAMGDGMARVKLGLHPQKNTSSMWYFGLAGSPDAVWYEMVAPPPECHTTLLRVCLSLAGVRHSFPASGVIPAVKDHTSMSIRFDANDESEFMLSWD